MEQKDLRMLLLAAILDKQVRDAVAEDPEAAIKEMGYTATPGQITRLKELKPEEWENMTVKELAERLQGLSREEDEEGIPIK